MPHLVKIFGGDVDAAVEPAGRPFVEVNAVENGSVAQRRKEFVLLNERQAVEDALAAIIESQVQPIVIKGAGGCNPFEFVCLFHTLIQRVDFHQSLAILHAFPVQHQFVLMLVEPLEDQMQRTTWHLSSHSTRMNVDGGTILR